MGGGSNSLMPQGRGWKVGEVKEKLSELVKKHSQVPKKAAYTYSGPNIGEQGLTVTHIGNSYIRSKQAQETRTILVLQRQHMAHHRFATADNLIGLLGANLLSKDCL